MKITEFPRGVEFGIRGIVPLKYTEFGKLVLLEEGKWVDAVVTDALLKRTDYELVVQEVDWSEEKFSVNEETDIRYISAERDDGSSFIRPALVYQRAADCANALSRFTNAQVQEGMFVTKDEALVIILNHLTHQFPDRYISTYLDIERELFKLTESR